VKDLITFVKYNRPILKTKFPFSVFEVHNSGLSFLYTARGSLEEVRYFLFLAQDLGFVTSDIYRDLENNCQEVSLMLNL